MAQGFKVECSSSFRTVATRFRYEEKQIMGATMMRFVRSAQIAARMEARQQLMEMVYRAPLPKSVRPRRGSIHGGALSRNTYLEVMQRRRGDTYKAVRYGPVVPMGGNLTYGETKTDITAFGSGDRPGVKIYYPYILNRGRNDIEYNPRPYWTVMYRIMAARVKELGGVELKNMKTGFSKGYGFMNVSMPTDEGGSEI